MGFSEGILGEISDGAQGRISERFFVIFSEKNSGRITERVSEGFCNRSLKEFLNHLEKFQKKYFEESLKKFLDKFRIAGGVFEAFYSLFCLKEFVSK